MPSKLSIIRVEGDSMAPTLNAGDDILVDPADCAERLRDGIYVLRVDEALGRWQRLSTWRKIVAVGPRGAVVTRFQGANALVIAASTDVQRQLGEVIRQLDSEEWPEARDTLFTIWAAGIDTPEITKQKVREAEPFPVLKIKVGLDKDESTLEAVRSVTQKPLRLDANEGFKSKEEAVRKINWLESLGARVSARATGNPRTVGMRFDPRQLTDALVRAAGGPPRWPAGEAPPDTRTG